MALKERKIYPKFTAEARDGRLYLENEESYSNYLLSIDRKPLTVIVKPKHKDRSRQEEKFYHAVVVRMVAEAMTIEDQEAHDFLKRMFLKIEDSREIKVKMLIKDENRTSNVPEEKITYKTVRYERILSTTELSDKAYREYWGKCIHWAALPTKDEGLGFDSGLSLYISFPNEVDYESY